MDRDTREFSETRGSIAPRRKGAGCIDHIPALANSKGR
jgi:hypothetical protein